MSWTVSSVLAARDRGFDNFASLWRFLCKDGQRVELATLQNQRGPFSGRERPGRRFVGTLDEALEAWNQSQELYRPDGSYIRMNRYDLSVEARPGTVPGRWHTPNQGCSAADITWIDAIYLDFDPLPKSDCATPEQTWACVQTGIVAIEDYHELIPYEAMGIGASGNGSMVLLATEPLENTLENARLIQMLTRGAALRHTSSEVKVDMLADPGRLIPACGVRKRKNGSGSRGTSPLKPTSFLCADQVVRITREQLELLVERWGAPIERVEHHSQIAPCAEQQLETWQDYARAIRIERVYLVLARSPEGRAFGLNPNPDKPCCPRCIALGGLGRRGRGVFLATLDSRWPANKLRCRHDTCGGGQTRLNNIDLVTWVLTGHETMHWTDEPVVREWFRTNFGRDLEPWTTAAPRSRPIHFTR